MPDAPWTEAVMRRSLFTDRGPIADEAGGIADDPGDVEVRVNGSPVAVEAVYGLLGQVVLAAEPASGADVEVDYGFVRAPTVPFAKLNSPEFCLNGWARDRAIPGRHVHRYNAVLFAHPLQSPQPQVRDLKYRAFERLYTAGLNDPERLVLNSPAHKVSYPQLSRTVSPSFVNYEGTKLPDAAWEQHGGGTAAIANSRLVATDDQDGPYPEGKGIFWTRSIDLTFSCIVAMTWRLAVTATASDGVFTGIAAGFADESKAIVVGYLSVAGVKKLGFLRSSGPNQDVNPQVVTSWVTTNTAFDWTLEHGYRLFTDKDGVTQLFLDGSIEPLLTLLPEARPTLSQLNAPFGKVQGAFFGSLSNEAKNISRWNFIRYLISPFNPFETAPSVSVAFEADTYPEVFARPWTPIGMHGVETLRNGLLILDSTSAGTDPSRGGLIAGDFRGYTRIEPLLSEAFETTLDVKLALRTFTHGVTPNAVTAAVDDGSYLMQLCFLASESAPKLSYGGRSLPTAFAPAWTAQGQAQAKMVGQRLRIDDSTVGLVYSIEDLGEVGSDARVVGPTTDYCFEFRVQVLPNPVPDASGFIGVMAAVDDGAISVGIQLSATGVDLHADGVRIAGFAFNWQDGAFHTYRAAKSTLGNLVTLFADGLPLGSAPYAGPGGFGTVPPAVRTGLVSFGSATPASAGATSSVIWEYANFWRVNPVRKYVGLWRGRDPHLLCGYHLPTRATGDSGVLRGNTLTDSNKDFVALGVRAGDSVVIDSGPNKGSYVVATPASPELASQITVEDAFPAGLTVTYRIVKEVDWTTPRRYRVVKRALGGVAVFADEEPAPFIECEYGAVDLPVSAQGIGAVVAAGMPSVFWGAFDPTNLSQTAWDFVRYNAVRSSAQGIATENQVLNQRNVIASFEHHRTRIAHVDTGFWSESEGIPSQVEPDLLRNPNLPAWTQLQDTTPLIPRSQALGSDPLYSGLEVIETPSGDEGLLASLDDEVSVGELSFQHKTCLPTYDGSTLPEVAGWECLSEDPDGEAHQLVEVAEGVLVYGTDEVGTRTVYRKQSGLLENPSLPLEIKFKLTMLLDATGGLGDSQVRVGVSAPGLTVALAFVSTPLGERYVKVLDVNSGDVVGGIAFDFYDGASHTYRLIRDPGAQTIGIFIDS